jgi:hypothetical protein
MTSIQPRINRMIVIAAVLAIAGPAPIVRAQDDEEAEERIQANPPGALNFQAEQRQMLLMRYKAQFDQWVRSEFGSPDVVGDQLEMQLATRLLELEAECHLTPPQVKKLRLAGRGDVKRFMDRFDGIARTFAEPHSSVDDLRTAMLEMQDLRGLARQRLFDEKSLLGKTLAGTLDRNQVAERELSFVERNKIRYQVAVSRAIKTLQGNLGLKKVQSAKLEAILLRETQAPRRFGNAPDIALVLFQASRVPEEKIRSIFDDDQWKTLSRWMAVYIKGASGEKMLTRNGYVFADERELRP